MQEDDDQSKLTPEKQLNLVREHLLKDALERYKNFIMEFTKLPFDINVFSKAIDHFDDGILWVKESILYAPLIQKPIPNATEEQKTHVCKDSGIEFPVKE